MDQWEKFIQAALSEDIGEGDHSTLACIDKKADGKAVLKIKDEGIFTRKVCLEYVFSIK